MSSESLSMPEALPGAGAAPVPVRSGDLRGLLGRRLRWYSQATALLLLRRWQAIVLGMGVFAPVGGSLLGVATYPTLVLLDPGLGIGGRFLGLCLWQGVWALWALMQREQVRGGAFMDYLRTLPVAPGAWRRMDLAVLLIADTPLLLLVVSAAVALGLRPLPPAQMAQGALLLAYLLCSQLCAQLAALHERRQVKSSFVLANTVATLALALPPAPGAALLLLPLGASVHALACGVPTLPLRWRGAARRLAGPLWRAGAALRRRLPRNVQLSLDVLYRQHRSVLLGKLLSCSVVTVASLGLMDVWRFDERCLPMALIACALIALSASGLYRFLHQAHQEAAAYTAALPLPRRWWRLGDTPAVLSFGLPFALLLGTVLWRQAGVPAAVAGAALGSFVLLLSLLRWAQLFSARHAVLSSTVLAALWTAAVAAVLPT